MNVILLENVENLGAIGDLVKVKAGFGRNFLLRQGKAALATPEHVKATAARAAGPRATARGCASARCASPVRTATATEKTSC